MRIHRHIAVLTFPMLVLTYIAGGQDSGTLFDHNLVSNGNADTGAATTDAGAIPGWANPAGTPVVKAYPPGPKSPLGVPADHGTNFFTAASADKSTLSQVIDLSPGITAIDGGGVTFELSAYLAGEGSDDDNARVTVSFADDKKQEIGSAMKLMLVLTHRCTDTLAGVSRGNGSTHVRSGQVGTAIALVTERW